MSPAMAAGIFDTLITWEPIVEAMDADQPAKKRGPISGSIRNQLGCHETKYPQGRSAWGCLRVNPKGR